MELMTIQTAMTSLKTALDIVKGFKNIKSDAEMQSKISELLGALIDVQNGAISANEAQFVMQERIRELEAQLRNLDDWEQQKDRYVLVSPWRGPAQVNALKQSCAAEGEPAHYLCPTCFLKSQRIILSPIFKDHFTQMTCSSCKTVMNTGYNSVGPPRFAEEHNKNE